MTHAVRGQPWRAPVGLDGLPFQLWAFVAQLFVGYYTQAIKLRHGGGLVLLFALVGLIALAIVSRRRHPRDASLLLVLTAGPILLGVAALFRGGAMDLARYLGYSLPFVAIAASRGWMDLLFDAVDGHAARDLVAGAAAGHERVLRRSVARQRRPAAHPRHRVGRRWSAIGAGRSSVPATWESC